MLNLLVANSYNRQFLQFTRIVRQYVKITLRKWIKCRKHPKLWCRNNINSVIFIASKYNTRFWVNITANFFYAPRFLLTKIARPGLHMYLQF